MNRRFLLLTIILLSSFTLLCKAQSRLCLRDQNGTANIKYMLVGMVKKDTILVESGCVQANAKFKDKMYTLIIINSPLGYNKTQFFYRATNVNLVGNDSCVLAVKIPVSLLNGKKPLILYMRHVTTYLNPNTKTFITNK